MRIVTSSNPIAFWNILGASSAESEKFQVPKIDAVWWVEVTPGYNGLSFGSSAGAPTIKLFIQVKDDELINSNLLSATINISETGDRRNLYKTFFHDYSVPLDKTLVMVTTDSNKYKSSAQYYRNDNAYIYSTYYNWPARDMLQFDCTVSFEYQGDFDFKLHNVKRLLSSGNDAHLGNFASLQSNETYTDFVFNVRNKQFKVHKCVLSAASEAFNLMFSCGLEESRNNSANIDCKPEIFNHFLTFIYANTVPFDDMPTICLELHELAHCYGIGRLAMICREYIMAEEVNASNAIQLYEFAATHEIETLLTTSWDFIKT